MACSAVHLVILSDTINALKPPEGKPRGTPQAPVPRIADTTIFPYPDRFGKAGPPTEIACPGVTKMPNPYRQQQTKVAPTLHGSSVTYRIKPDRRNARTHSKGQVTRRGELVRDSFLGSGTLTACMRLRSRPGSTRSTSLCGRRRTPGWAACTGAHTSCCRFTRRDARARQQCRARASWPLAIERLDLSGRLIARL